ncbi:hypothetical protein [Bradyrhizobium sp. SZCCHNS3051]|uniref:hypothetical protein n=1 Tax=Bradyrhizobium sp. SZCCHNS3051 TaxID=3057320 RepID=UPI0029167894|nr:hypothetical protein [Bradyrhizobium sp. SZCCHNS3051]
MSVKVLLETYGPPENSSVGWPSFGEHFTSTKPIVLFTSPGMQRHGTHPRSYSAISYTRPIAVKLLTRLDFQIGRKKLLYSLEPAIVNTDQRDLFVSPQ